MLLDPTDRDVNSFLFRTGIRAHISIVLNAAHNRAPFLGHVCQLHRKREPPLSQEWAQRRTYISDSLRGS